VAQSPTSLARISLTSREIFTTLSFFNLGQFGSVVFPIYVPPNGVAVFEYDVPPNRVLIPDTLAFYTTADGVLQVVMFSDTNLILYDPAFYNENYPPGGIVYFELGNLIVTKTRLYAQIQNNSSTGVYFFIRMEYGLIDSTTFNALLAKYFQTVMTFISS